MDQYMGTVLIWAPNFAPRQFAYCAGQIMGIAQNTALFSLLGTNYGGNGSTTFGLPDLRSRVPIGAGMGQGPGLSSYPLGVMGGVEQVTLNVTQMPLHNHMAQAEIVAHDTPATSSPPVPGGTLATANTPSGIAPAPTNMYAPVTGTAVTLAPGSVAVQIASSGGSLPHENRQPFAGLSYIICVEGIFPPRS